MDLLDLRTLGSIVVVHLWQSSLVLALIFLLAALMRGAPARLLHGLWMAALCKVLLPLPLLGGMSFGLVDRLFPWVSSEATNSSSSGLAGLGSLLSPELLVVRPEGGAAEWDPLGLLALLWAAGAAVIVALWIRAAARARAALVPAGAVPEAISSRLRQASEATGIPEDRILLTAGRTGPAVIGLLRPRILLPSVLVQRLEVSELRAILLHEEAHRRRRDPLLGMLQRLAILCFYYYPLLWPLLNRLRSATEMACDEHALSRAVPRETYARALARTVSLGLGPSPSLAAEGHSRSLLQKRFDRIAEHGRYVAMRRHLVFLAVGVLVVSVGSFFPVAPLAGPESRAAAEMAGGDLQFVELNRLREKDLAVILRFKDTGVDRVLTSLSSVAGLHLKYEGAVPTLPIDLDTSRLSLKQSLTELSRMTGVRYRVPDPDTLIVIAPGGSVPADGTGLGTSGGDGTPRIAGADGVTRPERIADSYVQPHYPDEAREQRLEAKVILQAVVLADGSVGELEVLNSTMPGYGFERAALEAIEQWRYEPATENGQPVPVYFTVVMEFDLQ